MINLIPMAGRGNRFFQQLYNLPKPFIPIMDEPMFLAAVKSFPSADKYIFLCRTQHVERYQLDHLFENRFQQHEVILVDELTEGQACTCLLAKKSFDLDDGLFIASCDYQTIYDEKKYEALMRDKSVDVIIWTFKIDSIKKADPKAFAYCRTEGGRVIEVVEKKTISDTPEHDLAVVGSFTYKKASAFVDGARQMIAKNIRVNNEFYVGTSINQLIAAGLNVVTFEIDQFISFGTPFELSSVHYWQEYFDALEDHPYQFNYGFHAKARTS